MGSRLVGGAKLLFVSLFSALKYSVVNVVAIFLQLRDGEYMLETALEDRRIYLPERTGSQGRVPFELAGSSISRPGQSLVCHNCYKA